MRLFGLPLILSSRVMSDHIPTVVSKHKQIPLFLISFGQSCIVLVELFPMLITYFATVQWKEIKMGMGNVYLQRHCTRGLCTIQEVSALKFPRNLLLTKKLSMPSFLFHVTDDQ